MNKTEQTRKNKKNQMVEGILKTKKTFFVRMKNYKIGDPDGSFFYFKLMFN